MCGYNEESVFQTHLNALCLKMFGLSYNLTLGQFMQFEN